MRVFTPVSKEKGRRKMRMTFCCFLKFLLFKIFSMLRWHILGSCVLNHISIYYLNAYFIGLGSHSLIPKHEALVGNFFFVFFLVHVFHQTAFFTKLFLICVVVFYCFYIFTFFVRWLSSGCNRKPWWKLRQHRKTWNSSFFSLSPSLY